jgi:hypothetical protein
MIIIIIIIIIQFLKVQQKASDNIITSKTKRYKHTETKPRQNV